MYHHAKFHADRCHFHRDICNQIDTKMQRITANLISDKSYTSVAFVDKIWVCMTQPFSNAGSMPA